MRPRSRVDGDRAMAGPRAVFGPPPEPSGSLLLRVLFWLVVGAVVLGAYSWREQRLAQQQRVAPVPPAVRLPVLPAPAVGQLSVPRAAPHPPTAVPAVPAVPAVRRCLRDGQVLLTDQPCDAAQALQAAPSRAVPAPEAQRASSGEIYLCKAYDGRFFWASTHCNQHRAHIDRIARVPPDLPFEDQVRIGQQQRQAALARQDAPAVVPAAVPHPAVAVKAQCEALEMRVRNIDEEARRPLPAQWQDRLAAERKEARDAQFRLRC